MTITKFVHSCLLVETSDFTALIDPGNFSFNSHLLNVSKLEKLDYIVITHEHKDHYYEPFLRSLVKHLPHALIITNETLLSKIAELNLPNQLAAGSDNNLVVFEAAHEPLPLNMPKVPNIGVHIGGKLTHPGDSFDFEHAREVLALPMTGPWGSLREALKKVVKLKPKAVIPIHDWEWHKAAREARYAMSRELLAAHGIKFVELENAVPVEL